MRPLTVNLILLAAYTTLGLCWLLLPAENTWRWLGVVGGLASVGAMMMLKRPDTGGSILFRNGLWVPFYIP